MNLFQAVTGLGTQQPKFKEICTPQERWKKHLNIVKGNPNHISVVIEKAATSKIALKKPYLLYSPAHIDSEYRKVVRYSSSGRTSVRCLSSPIRIH